MDKFNLTEEEKKVHEDTYKSFIRNGAALSREDKEKLRKINEEDLSGLPEGIVKQAAAMGKSINMEGKCVYFPGIQGKRTRDICTSH
jgi:Zn-dependent oligopeptidase